MLLIWTKYVSHTGMHDINWDGNWLLSGNGWLIALPWYDTEMMDIGVIIINSLPVGSIELVMHTGSEFGEDI